MGKQQGCTAGLLATENILSGVPCQAKRPVDGSHLARKKKCAEAQLQRIGEKHGYPREQERYRQGIRFILTEHGNDACMYRQYNKVKMELQKNFLRNNDLGLLLLRLAVGGLMLFHGIAKAMGGYVFVAAMLAERGLPSGLVWLSVAAELLCSLMIVLGLYTRAAAVVMAGNMVVAVFMAHAGLLFSINEATGGWAVELPMLYLLGSAVLVLTGGGKYAVTRRGILS